VLLAVNGRQATEEAALADGDELAILPPLAGG
jgi:molybdopterin converting factor small subunit